MKILLTIALIALLFTTLAHGQSACGVAGIDCSHPNISQRPSGDGGNNSGDNNNTGRDASDYASDHTDNAYVYLNRYQQSGLLSDFQAAQREFNNAIANIDNYGPAELGLCRLYSYSKDYKQAYTACLSSLESHRLDRKVKKSIKKDLMAWILLRWRGQWISEESEKWKQMCAWSTTSASNGSTVDPASNITQYLADCAKGKANLDAQIKRLAKDNAAYDAKH